MQPKVLIIGSKGQDGYYLSEFLSSKGYVVIGLDRNNGGDSGVDISNEKEVIAYLGDIQPEHIYFLAAYHRSTETKPDTLYLSLDQSLEVHVKALLNVFRGMQERCPKARLFYAGSSHVFGDPSNSPQNEETSFNPDSPYGITKAMGIQLSRLFRKEQSLFASCGILYNHESPRRSSEFISRKIARGVADIVHGQAKTLVLGDLSAAVDWGAAEDYVKAMHSILCLEEPDDFIIASGQLHTVAQFAEIAFRSVGLDSKLYVRQEPNLIRKKRRSCPLLGDASKLTARTGWKPLLSFEDMVTSMVRSELTNG